MEGKRIAARTVLWAAGVCGTPLARSLGIQVDRHGRVPVTPTLRAPGLPNVFVIGDLAALAQDGARETTTPTQLAAAPLSGSLFAYEAPVAGLQAAAFRG